MRFAWVFPFIVTMAGTVAPCSWAQGPDNRNAIEQELTKLVQHNATSDEINGFLLSRHASAEAFCPSIPEHRDCLQKPTYTFRNAETATLRLLADSLRVQPASVTIHIAVVCLRAESGTLLVLPSRAGVVHQPQTAEILCTAPEDTVYLDVLLPGQYAYGQRDAGTADQFMLEFLQR